jgi:hypothetical protein
MSDLTSTISRPPGLLRQVASWPKSRFWQACADLHPALCAAALPWSTSAVAFIMFLWLWTTLLSIEPARFAANLRRPAALLPLLFVTLALVGTLWTDDSWPVRLLGLSPVIKLAVIPLLIDRFERSGRGHWTLIAFLASCSLLMGLSWLDYLAPGLHIAPDKDPGVPVRNYIDQSQEFGLAVFALAPLVLIYIRKRRMALAIACGVLLVGFLANMARRGGPHRLHLHTRTGYCVRVPLFQSPGSQHRAGGRGRRCHARDGRLALPALPRRANDP